MNEPIKDNLIKTLAMAESLRKSRAMITYISDLAERQRFMPPEGHNRKSIVNKTYVKDFDKKETKPLKCPDR